MRITVLSQYAAEHYQPKTSAACISITGTYGPQATIPQGYQEVLRLVFDDVRRGYVPPGARLFDTETATRIAQFAARNQGVEEMIVHCHQGVSRSAGVAMALADAFAGGVADKSFEYRLPHHHKEVRHMTRHACMEVSLKKQVVDIRTGLGNTLITAP